MIQSAQAFDWLAAILPLAGIALSWWSFRFSEEGATPDHFEGHSYEITDLEVEQLERGMRSRARWSARVLFNAGALLLAAAVPMGTAANHVQDRINLVALSGFALVAFALCYVGSEVIKIWLSRRDDAFGVYFDRGGIMQSLYDEGKTAKLYFALNPMPLWSLLNRAWFKSRKLPDISDVVAQASKPRAAE